MVREHFPLVSDEEPIIGEAPVMDLYDDRDLISNIVGFYQEPVFTPSASVPVGQESGQQLPLSPRVVQPKQVYQPRKKKPVQEISYTQVARAQAREDLKKKRSAPYLNFDKPGFKSKELPRPKPNQRDKDKAQLNELTKAANRLSQTTYIKAEIHPVYQHVAPVQEEAPKKNPYDFLRTSRIYNHQDNQIKKEKKLAQELNLTRFEQWKKL